MRTSTTTFAVPSRRYGCRRAGGARRVTVTTAGGGAAINYYPHYSPGFDFTDTTPGSTIVTNIDTENSNGVLVVIDGSASVTVTSRISGG